MEKIKYSLLENIIRAFIIALDLGILFICLQLLIMQIFP